MIDMLLATMSYPERTAAQSISRAVDFAALMGSTLSCVSFEIAVSKSLGFIGEGLVDVEGMIKAVRERSALSAKHVLDDFRRMATERNVLGSALSKVCPGSDLSALLVAESRVHDLTIVPTAEVDGLEQWYAEAVVFGSGHPVLVLPKDGPAPQLNSVLVAWDGTRAASRALFDAIPILSRAHRITVASVVGEKPLPDDISEGDLTRYLNRHGLEAGYTRVDAQDRPIGEVLTATARKLDCDLLVMGAFGHSRLRDFILGGATRSMLADPPLTLLLSH